VEEHNIVRANHSEASPVKVNTQIADFEGISEVMRQKEDLSNLNLLVPSKLDS